MSVLVGRKAPEFKVGAVVKKEFVDIALVDFKDKNFVVLFFYPLNFTSVCNSEMHAFQSRLADFETRGVALLGCSCESQFSHLAWMKQPDETGGIASIGYPILADMQKTIAKDYDVLTEAGYANRGLFIIDKQGIVKHQSVFEANVGRNVDEILRVVDALQYIETNGEFCPANWKSGHSTLTNPVAVSSPKA